MLIQVGIHENLKLSSDTKVNEHGTLELAIESIQDDSALLAAFQSNATADVMKSSFRFYPPNLTDFNNNPRTAADIAGDLLRMKDQFMTIAKLYAPEATVDSYIGGTKMFDGLGIAPEQMAKAVNALTNKEFLGKVVTNLGNKFVDFLAKANAYNGGITFRMKFLRQSKLKNYAVISRSSFDTWIEPMSIPKAASKIAFTKYEIDNGKNDPNPAAGDEATTTTEEAVKGAELFGVAETPAPVEPAVSITPPVTAAPVQPTTAQPDLTAPAPGPAADFFGAQG